MPPSQHGQNQTLDCLPIPAFSPPVQQWNHNLPGCLHQKLEPSSTSCFLSSHSPALNPSAYSVHSVPEPLLKISHCPFCFISPTCPLLQPYHHSPALLSHLPQGLPLLLSPLRSFLYVIDKGILLKCNFGHVIYPFLKTCQRLPFAR